MSGLDISMITTQVIINICVAIPIVFLPTLIAFGMRKRHRWWVLLANLTLGWTPLWLGVFIWAFCWSAEPKEVKP